MKYIYDILLNFNEKLYEFYEWHDCDNFDYVKKIAIIKVNKDTLNDIRNNKIMLDDEFVKEIHNTCEVYTSKSIKSIEYACLFTSNSSIIACLFNYKGISIMKSDLLLDEGLDIIEICKKIKPVTLKYTIISKEDKELITRHDKKKLIFMKQEINNMYKNNNIDKLKYLYYECFNKNEESIIKIYEILTNYINTIPSELYNLLMLPYMVNKS